MVPQQRNSTIDISLENTEVLKGYSIWQLPNNFVNGKDKIIKTYESNKKFSFQQVTEGDVLQVILSIDGSKATPVGDNPASMLKVTLDIHLSGITKIINLSFENVCFPDDLKLTKVSPISNKNDDLDKENYRPVSVLCNVSKVF